MKTRVPAAVVLALLLGAPAASADEQITAGPPSVYVTPSVTIDQGEKITLYNTDVAAHDVLARDLGPDEKPLFSSELAALGETVPVTGAESLTTGEYAFLCSIHPQMEGTITVTSAGKPVPRPGAQSELKVQVLDKRLAAVEKRRALRVRVTASAEATVRITARAKGAVFAKGTTKVSGEKASTAKLSLTRAGRRLVARGKKVKVKVTATAKGDAKTSAETTLR
jgi:plastocyanin